MNAARLLVSFFLLPCFLMLARETPAQTKHALLIGVNQYHPEGTGWLPASLASGHKADSRFGQGETWHNLNGPANDVLQMNLLLKSFGFEDISILREPGATPKGQLSATRQGILDALKAFQAKTHPGDVVVFYFSGHGSRRVDTTRPTDSDKGQWDQTIVPADAWQGAPDITDKELAREFNQIVYDKQARLVAIFDSCNSGTQARGLTAGVTRTLPYDDRDVAKDPQAYTGADLKRLPKDGNAVILSAAGPLEEAQEALYPLPDDQSHGAFTRALVKVLSEAPNLRAVDIINSVDQLMRADRLPLQQPSVEGKADEPLFGSTVSPRLRVTVVGVENGIAHLNVGSLAGFGPETTFSAVTGAVSSAHGPTNRILTVTSVDGPTASSASITPANVKVSPGEIFELKQMIYPAEAKLHLFVSSKGWDPLAAPADKGKALFTGLEWKPDPALDAVQYLVIYSGHEWGAIDLNGKSISPSEVRALTAAGKERGAFFAVPPTKALVAALEKQPAFQSGGIVLTDDITQADYLLLGRPTVGGLEYALFRPSNLSSRPAKGYVETTVDEKNAETKVVCSQTDSFPVRSEWVHLADGAADASQQGGDVEGIGRRIAKLRAWSQLWSKPDGTGEWPYHVDLKTANGGSLLKGSPLPPNTKYEIDLLANKDDLASKPPSPQFVYVVGVDCAAQGGLRYPPRNSNGGAALPQLNTDGTYPDRIALSQETIVPPFGADSIFLLTTPDKITDLSVFNTNRVISRSRDIRGTSNNLRSLIEGLGDITARGWPEVPEHWTVQHIVVPSANQ